MRKYSILILCCVLTFMSCKKDQGNYDYSDVNVLTVVDADGITITNKTYYLSYGNELSITPKVTNSLTQNNTDLRFSWILAGDTISNATTLKMTSEEIGPGTKLAKLIVTDKTTKANYSYNFTVVVSASISKGSFIFNEDEDHNAIITMKATGENTPYLTFKEFNGYKLGKYPLSLELGYKATSLTNRNFLSLVTLVKESDNPVMVTDIGTLNPTLLYNKQTAMIDNGLFNPTYLNISTSNLSTNKHDGYTIVNGKARVIAKGIVGEDMYKTDPYNYNVGTAAITPSTTSVGYFMALYDQNNQRIRLFGNNSTGSRYNIFSRDYDELISKDITAGHTYVASGDLRPANTEWLFQFLTRKNNDLYSHNLTMKITSPLQPASFTSSAAKNIANLDKAVQFRYHNGLQFWYFALGRTIYRFSYLGLDVQPFITLPNDGSGDIVAWNFEVAGASTFTKVGIATYDSAANKPLKGSYYVYNIATNTYDVADTYVINKTVDIRIGI